MQLPDSDDDLPVIQVSDFISGFPFKVVMRQHDPLVEAWGHAEFGPRWLTDAFMDRGSLGTDWYFKHRDDAMVFKIRWS